jgi:excisionase family DNA binding protein
MSDEPLLPTGSAARQLGVSREWLVHLCETGRLRHVRDGTGRRLLREADVLRLAEQRRARQQASKTAD